MEDLEINNMIEDKISEHKKDCNISQIDNKMDKDTFWKIFIPVITYLVLTGMSIGNLYILYYSGLTEIKVDVAVIKEKVLMMQKQSTNSIDLNKYDVTSVK